MSLPIASQTHDIFTRAPQMARATQQAPAHTALFRYRHYHTAADTEDKVDIERLARVLSSLTRVVMRLAEGT